MTLQRFAQRCRLRGGGGRAGNHNQIETGEHSLHNAETFPNTTLDAISNHRFGRDAPRYRHTHARVSQLVGAYVHAKKMVALGSAGAGDLA